LRIGDWRLGIGEWGILDCSSTETGHRGAHDRRRLPTRYPSLIRPTLNPSDERQAFLGHLDNGTDAFYESDTDQSDLVRLVNLIGDESRWRDCKRP